jgi:hypothetical protein
VPIQEAGGAARFYMGQPTTTQALLFTNSQTELKAVIREIYLSNNASAQGTIQIEAGPNNSANTGNILPVAFPMLGAATSVISCNIVLNPNDTIWGIQSNATGFTVVISGEYLA